MSVLVRCLQTAGTPIAYIHRLLATAKNSALGMPCRLGSCVRILVDHDLVREKKHDFRPEASLKDLEI